MAAVMAGLLLTINQASAQTDRLAAPSTLGLSVQLSVPASGVLGAPITIEEHITNPGGHGLKIESPDGRFPLFAIDPFGHEETCVGSEGLYHTGFFVMNARSRFDIKRDLTKKCDLIAGVYKIGIEFTVGIFKDNSNIIDHVITVRTQLKNLTVVSP